MAKDVDTKKPPMSRAGFFVRLAVCVAIDLIDFTLGRVILLPVGEGIGTLLMVVMFGWSGLAYALEIADFTEQIDGFIPTATIIALLYGWRTGVFARSEKTP